MNYATIKNCDIANGPGVRVSLFVSGCTHRCPGCFNEVAWDFDYGTPFTDETVENLTVTMQEFIRRDFNHPSIIAWVPLNESWGVPQIQSNKKQQDTATMLYYLTKAADGTRICSGNDGWEQMHTDICGLHNYKSSKEVLKEHFADRHFLNKFECRPPL